MSIDNQPQIGGFPARTASSSVPSRPAVATLPPPDPRAAVSIRGLYKRFDRKIAVNGLSLDIPVGSFFGLVGPNGAGKTTTLNMVTGLLVPDAGTAMILGQDVWQDVNAAKRAQSRRRPAERLRSGFRRGHDGVRLFRGHDQEDLPGVRDDSQPAHPGA